MQTSAPMCWICRNNAAETGEHMIKKSDLKALLGKNAQGGPFYCSDARRANQIVQSINSKILMSPVPICAYCNNARTQPHDLAWEWMSNWLRTNPRRLRAGDWIRCNRIFPYNTQRQMLNVHLYFVKLFGGMICEGALKEAEGAEKLRISVTPFADAIMENRAHKEVFLQFGIGDGSIGRSNLNVQRREDRKYTIAHWIYRVGPAAVNVLFLQEGERWENLHTAWNPMRRYKKRLLVADTRTELRNNPTVTEQ
jgi:hypothetical protein